ncbi:MAG: phosphoribosylaminoimidazolecarboxamide formyltransferase [Chloroflexota bacterium]|nr:phosphoribosylaminoimidazolecarboxamide formyltransferase [Chloroflexota bacterium]
MALTLRYGVNPHQTPARAFLAAGDALPLSVLNGAPGYINLLDALNAWQLVRELRAVLGAPAAASFKHLSPAGAAIGLPLSEPLRRAYFVGPDELSPLACAYARARGADRVSSYGDWAALSDRVDLSTARLLRREVSDGVIAPDYEPEALAVLRAKRGGAYTVLCINADYEPPLLETRQVFGVSLEQARNTYLPSPEGLRNVVTRRQHLPVDAVRDMLLAQVVLKYTQSNSVCLVAGGQVIGNGAGQQSRIHCTRLACDKADLWWLRQHRSVLDRPWPDDRVERDNAIDEHVRGMTVEAADAAAVTLGSDAFIPFRDNIDRASGSGVEYIVQPGGAMREAEIIAACDEHGMAMALTGVRLFHH